MKREVTDEMMLRYEGLVISTSVYWRHKIPQDIDTADVRQELRIKVMWALQNYKADRGMTENAYVFMALMSRIKDLTKRTRRREEHEVALDMESLNGKSPIYVEVERYELPHGMTDLQQKICILIIEGFPFVDIQKALSLTAHEFQVQKRQIRSVLEPASAPLAVCV